MGSLQPPIPSRGLIADRVAQRVLHSSRRTPRGRIPLTYKPAGTIMNSNIHSTAATLTGQPHSSEIAIRGNADHHWYVDHPFHCLHCRAKLTRKNWFPKRWDRQDQWYPSRWTDADPRKHPVMEICQSCVTPEATERRDGLRMGVALKALLERTRRRRVSGVMKGPVRQALPKGCTPA